LHPSFCKGQDELLSVALAELTPLKETGIGSRQAASRNNIF